MKGTNRFDTLSAAVQQNFSKLGSLESLIKEAAKADKAKPCVFLSHKTEDKSAVLLLATYLADAGVDYYLDSDDINLKRAVEEDNHKAITEFIELGINNSTHIMIVASKNTHESWWVPYEIGFGKKGAKRLAYLRLKGDTYIPSYLQIIPEISGIASLNSYVKELKIRAPKIQSTKQFDYVVEGYLNQITLPESSPGHPLQCVLEP